MNDFMFYISEALRDIARKAGNNGAEADCTRQAIARVRELLRPVAECNADLQRQQARRADELAAAHARELAGERQRRSVSMDADVALTCIADALGSEECECIACRGSGGVPGNTQHPSGRIECPECQGARCVEVVVLCEEIREELDGLRRDYALAKEAGRREALAEVAEWCDDKWQWQQDCASDPNCPHYLREPRRNVGTGYGIVAAYVRELARKADPQAEHITDEDWRTLQLLAGALPDEVTPCETP